MNFVKLTDRFGRVFYLNLNKVVSINRSDYYNHTIISCDGGLEYHCKETPEEILKYT